MKLTRTDTLHIVIPARPTQRETFAAAELEKYLKMLLPGLRVMTQSCAIPGKLQILVGHPAHNFYAGQAIAPADFDAAVPGPEGFMLRTLDERTLLVAGSAHDEGEWERGTVYAVYELLEKYAGCSFAAFVKPGMAGGEYIPTLESLDFSGVDHVKACADVSYRCATAQYCHGDVPVTHGLTIPFLDWLVKNRYNRIFTWASVYETYKKTGLLDEAIRRGIRFTAGHHECLRLFLPPEGNEYFPEAYAKTHPEYFRLQEDGTRYLPTDFWGQWTLCSRDPGVLSTITENIIAWLRQNPAVDVVTLMPQDGIAPQCCCAECRKYTKSQNYVWFVGQVASRVAEACPGVKIEMMAYVDLWDCPEGVTLSKNVIVDEATWHHTGLRTIGKPDGSCLAGTFFEEDLLKWQKAGASTVYYEYYMGVYPARQRWMPAADEIQALWKAHRAAGILGASTQIECFNFWNNIFNFYCFARTGYDTALSMEENLSRFAPIFGEGAQAVAEIIRLGEACLDGQADIMTAGRYVAEHIDRAAVDALFEEAFAAASTPFFRNNLRMMRMGWRYSDLECRTSDVYDDSNYSRLEPCADPTGELYFMSHAFDSFHWNDPGCGIMLPLDCAESSVDFSGDKWYQFE